MSTKLSSHPAGVFPLAPFVVAQHARYLRRRPLQALKDELERSRLEMERAVKERDSTIAAKDKEISQVRRR